jgi:hypothetical protein
MNADNIGIATSIKVGVLNKFLNSSYENIDEHVFFDFLKTFFIEADKNGLSLLGQKKRWNASVEFLEYVFELSEGTILKVPTKENKGFLTQIKTIKGKQVKTKLITEIPLEVTDNEAIKILFNQINQDVELVQRWVTHTINKTYNAFKNDTFKITKEEYGLSYPQIIRNRKLPKEMVLSSLLNDDGKVRDVFLLAVQFQLIIDHPIITESFFYNCELYNDKNNLHGISDSDAGTILISRECTRHQTNKFTMVGAST